MSMVLEWVRRRMPEFDQQLRRYLFTSAPLTEIERAAEEGTAAPTRLAVRRRSGNRKIGRLS